MSADRKQVKLVSLKAFTLVELLVVIGIIALLVAILLPALNKARQQGMAVACAANLHQIGLAVQNYATENKGYLPNGSSYDTPSGQLGTWMAKLAPYTVNRTPQKYATEFYGLLKPTVFVCPVKPERWLGYQANVYQGNFTTGDSPIATQPWKITRFRRAAKKVFCVDAALDVPAVAFNRMRNIWFHSQQDSPTDGMVDLRHTGRRANICFMDGHVEGVTARPVSRTKDVPYADLWLQPDNDGPPGQ